MAGSEAMPELLLDCDSWIRIGKPRAVLKATIATAQGQERHVRLELRRGDKFKDVLSRNNQSLDELDDALAHSNRNYLTVGYGVSRRLSKDGVLPSALTTFNNPRAKSVGTLFSPDAALNSLETWAIDLHYRLSDTGLKTVKAALENMLPHVTFKRIDKERRQLIFSTVDGDVPLSQLSDGYQNVAAWCGDLLFRITETFRDNKNPLNARGLLLIDEIDLHLHPVWKRSLVDYLSTKFPQLQILATTHSALTVHQAREGELFVLRREKPDGPATLSRYGGNPSNLMVHQLLLSPIFGLSSLDSKPVEEKKNEYRKLEKKKGKKSAGEDLRMKNLRAELQDVPEWSIESPYDKQRRELLASIDKQLRSRKQKTAGKKRGSRRND
jgi:hypothetical protein